MDQYKCFVTLYCSIFIAPIWHYLPTTQSHTSANNCPHSSVFIPHIMPVWKTIIIEPLNCLGWKKALRSLTPTVNPELPSPLCKGLALELQSLQWFPWKQCGLKHLLNICIIRIFMDGYLANSLQCNNSETTCTVKHLIIKRIQLGTTNK